LIFNASQLCCGVIYWKALFEFYEPTDNILEISGPMRDRFRNIVRDADLSSPLEKDILPKAKEALLSTDDHRLKRLVSPATNPINREMVMKIKHEDVVKSGWFSRIISRLNRKKK